MLTEWGVSDKKRQKMKLFVQKSLPADLRLLEMSDSNSQSHPPDAEDYLVLLNQHEKTLALYVHSLVTDTRDAEDILQACKLTMWKQFDQFEPGTNFPAWARKIALHQVLNFRRSEKRKPLYSTDPAFIESIAEEIDRQGAALTERAEALHVCLGKLPEKQRHTVLLRYYEGLDVDAIAEKTGRTQAAVYRLLSRIRAVLNECIGQQLEAAR